MWAGAVEAQKSADRVFGVLQEVGGVRRIERTVEQRRAVVVNDDGNAVIIDAVTEPNEIDDDGVGAGRDR